MAEAPKRARPKDLRERKPRFVLQLSDKCHALLTEMAEVRGGYKAARTVVVEEAIRRMYVRDQLVHGIKRKRKEGET